LQYNALSGAKVFAAPRQHRSCDALKIYSADTNVTWIGDNTLKTENIPGCPVRALPPASRHRRAGRQLDVELVSTMQLARDMDAIFPKKTRRRPL
jgi:hypothetical protein